MGAVNDLHLEGQCPACGGKFESRQFQFKCGGKNGDLYRIGDTLRWEEGSRGYMRPENGDWDSLASGHCPVCGEALSAILEIRKDVLGCAGIQRTNEEYRCFVCARQYPVEAFTSGELIGGSCDYGRYVCRGCLKEGILEGMETSEQVCGWCGDVRRPILRQGSHCICKECASLLMIPGVDRGAERCFACGRECVSEGKWPPAGKFIMLSWLDRNGRLICAECVATIDATGDGPSATCSLCKRAAPIRISRGGRTLCGNCFKTLKRVYVPT